MSQNQMAARPTQSIQLKTGTADTAKNLLAKLAPRLEKLLPRAIPVEKMIQVTLLSMARNPRLYECSAISLAQAVMECATLGLVPDGVLGQAYLIPYGSKATLVPGYRGLVSLASQAGTALMAHPVYKKDRFEYCYGLAPNLVHVPHRGADRGELVAAYCVARVKERTPEFLVMEGHEVDAIRAGSPGARKKDSPWNSTRDVPEMWRKCPIRKMAKLLDLSPEFNRAVAIEESAEMGIPGPAPADLGDLAPELEVQKPDPLDALAAKVVATAQEVPKDQKTAQEGNQDPVGDKSFSRDNVAATAPLVKCPDCGGLTRAVEIAGVPDSICDSCGWNYPPEATGPAPAQGADVADPVDPVEPRN